MEKPLRTLIGVLASHDDTRVNNALARVLDRCCKTPYRPTMEKFGFVFTGGTYRRVIDGKDSEVDKGNIHPVSSETREFLTPRTLIIPPNSQGGVTILSYLVVGQICSIIWAFFAPLSSHWLTPENLALMRLSDYWKAKRLMNKGTVEEWLEKEADQDSTINCQPFPPEITFRKGTLQNFSGEPPKRGGGGFRLRLPEPPPRRDVPEEMTLALIAHNDQKINMVSFAKDHKTVLARFRKILTTGTTGEWIQSKTGLANIFRYESGPHGGDIQIATEILFGQCDAVIFFIDPLNPHPHIDDVRVVLAACMRHDHVRLLTNEPQARDWIQRLILRHAGTP